MSYLKTECILLRSYKVGERDRIIRVFSRDFGKISLKVRGINKSSQKYGSFLEIFSEVSLTIYKKTNKSLPILTSMKSTKNWYDIRKDIKRYVTGSYILEIIDSFCIEEDVSNQSSYELLINIFNFLDKEISPNYIIIWFVFRFLKITGYEMLLSSCSVCNDEVLDDSSLNVISPHTGGIVCKKCDEKILYRNVITKDICLIIKAILNGLDYIKFRQFIENSSRITIYNIEKLTKNIISYYIDRKLKAENMLESMEVWTKE